MNSYKVNCDLGSLAESASSISKSILSIPSSSLSIGLIGELGAGKTTFTKLLLKALGVEELVSSPTYVLQQNYSTKELEIEHWDIYRLNGLPSELLDPPESNVIRIIEWANRASAYQDEIDLEISLSILSEGFRQMELLSHTKRGQAVLSASQLLLDQSQISE